MNTNRRGFLKGVLVGTGLGAVLGKVALFSGQVWANALELIDIDGTKRKDKANQDAVKILKPMGYVADADAAEKAGKIKRTDKPHPGGGNVPAKLQACQNCALYDATLINSDKPGKCMLAQMVLVHAKGYCNTYSVHPKANKA